ncbi:KRAB [Mytilus coruscus]|uniref:KRAB n=1 Tax=Mytilus coruscus TaxID=42192 RepID=A0A6J8CI49_MYTCO|nr:KRAB [Mytilus coruscus]
MENLQGFYGIKEEYTSATDKINTVQQKKEPDVYQTDYKQTNSEDIIIDPVKCFTESLFNVTSVSECHSTCAHDSVGDAPRHVKFEKENDEIITENGLEIGTNDCSIECEICSKDFSSFSNLRSHMTVHRGKSRKSKKFKCEICGRTFEKRYLLVNHEKSHIGDVVRDDKQLKFKCGVCGKQEPDKRGFENHLRVHTGERPFQCDVCDLSFKQKSHLRRHSRVHTGEFLHEGSFIQCEICSRHFGQNHQLIRHMKCHYPPAKKEYKCDLCPKEKILPIMTIKTDDESFFIQDPEYYEITEEVMEDEINVTEECVRLFYKIKEEYTSALDLVFTVHETEIYNSDYIPPEINTIAALQKDVENSQKERAECDVCLRKFSDRYTMIRHRLSHTGATPERRKKMDVFHKSKEETESENGILLGKLIQNKTLECKICYKSFSRNWNLKRHIEIHTGDSIHNRKCQCDICGKTFGRKSRLDNHVRSHNGDVTYEDKKFKFKCRVCGKLVQEKREFEDHMRVHTGERPFHCDLCHLSFKQMSHLRRHNRIHTGEFLHKEEPIQCEICGRYFGQRHQLTRHMKCHNPSATREYKCMQVWSISYWAMLYTTSLCSLNNV